MRKLTQTICAAAFMAVAAGCGGGSGYTIEGMAGGLATDGSRVYLVDPTLNSGEAVDSATVENGHYRLKGRVEEPWLAVLAFENGMVQCVVEPGTVRVEGDSIGGTPLNDRLQAATARLDVSDIEAQMRDLMPAYYEAPGARSRAEAERVIDSLEAVGNSRMLEVCRQLYAENGDNLLGVMAMETMVQVADFGYAELDSLLRTASPRVAASPTVQQKLEQLRHTEQTAVGKRYTDIEGVDGRLSDLIEGKVALVDFYASWCGPCRNEIRDNLVPLWKKYKDKGLVIVGLNVWERGDRAAREAAHAKVMADLGITYPQLVDSTLAATEAYGVQGIPQIILIGKDGTILARDLRGAAIEEAIAKTL